MTAYDSLENSIQAPLAFSPDFPTAALIAEPATQVHRLETVMPLPWRLVAGELLQHPLPLQLAPICLYEEQIALATRVILHTYDRMIVVSARFQNVGRS